MILETPIEIEEVQYDRLNISVAMMLHHQADGGRSATLNLRLVPARLHEGQLQTREDRAIRKTITCAAGDDQVSLIQDAIETIAGGLLNG